MSRYSGDVTLPDGRQFHVVAVFDWEPDTNASNLLSSEITTLDGEEIDADLMNERVEWPGSYDGWSYLWSACVDLVCQQEPEEYDPEL